MSQKRPDARSDTFWIPPGEEIRLSRDGRWLSDGRPITHQETCKAFARNIARDDQGYYVRLGYEAKRIVVEDTAWFVVGLTGDARIGYGLRLSDDATEPLDTATLSYRAPDRLTCRVRGGAEEARFLKPAYDEILRGLERDRNGYFVTIAGKRIDLKQDQE